MSPLEAQTYVPEGKYQMDHNTLWLIANGIARPTRPNGPRPYKSGPFLALPLGPCFNCGGDHWLSLSYKREISNDKATTINKILQ